MALDRDRLIKLLNMTQSGHDAEALSAMRLSNALLRQSKTSWTDLLADQVQPASILDTLKAEPRPPSRSEDSPRPKPANWGDDLFGDQPSAGPSVHAEKARVDQQDEEKRTLRRRIRSVPILVRVVFFPIWAFAETYVTAAHPEPWPIKFVALLVPIAAGGITSALWVLLARGIAKLF